MEFLLSFSVGVLIYLITLFLRDDTDHPIPIQDLKIPKSELVGLVIEWCHGNLREGRKPLPRVVVDYHRSKKYMGLYRSEEKEVVVYVNNHHTINDLIDTTIHEYQHHLQRDRSFQRQYNKFQDTLGYDLNPYEEECRKVSKENTLRCLYDLRRHHLIL
jgi:hypothetical protein